MNGRQRLAAALTGEPVDRAPIWLREGFPLIEGPAGADHFTRGWQADPAYRELFDHVAPHADAIERWSIPCTNRMLMVPPGRIRHEQTDLSEDAYRVRARIDTPKGELLAVSEYRRGHDTTWTVKHAVESKEDLAKLASVPFEIDPAHIDRAAESYRAAQERVGDRGVVRSFMSSPIVIISGCMSFEMFLTLSITDREWFAELAAEITRRELAVLEEIFSAGTELDTVMTFGGSEQCTPPMMAPEAYDEYVVPYEGRLIEWLKERGVLVTVHCHGKVRHALSCMKALGADGTDPVEPPPAGDVTYAEAREICGDALTIMGNLEFDALSHAEPGEIRDQVREILSHGNRRVILSASAGPVGAVTPRLAENYRAWVDAALEFGG